MGAPRRIAGCTLALLVAACGASSSTPPPVKGGPCTQVDADDRVLCGDFGHALGTDQELLVVGRVVAEEPDFDLATTEPNDDLTQDELANLAVELRISDDSGVSRATFPATSNDEGWVSVRLPLSDLGLSPGNYTVDVWAKRYWLASLNARLLPANYDAHLVVSDIDLTYLDTDFQTVDAALALLEESAAERVTLPAMPVVYQGLRRTAEANVNRPLTFLSGSPLFFRRVLQGRMDLDGIRSDGVALKPLTLLLTHELLEGLESEDWLRALAGDPGALLGSLGDQVGFKLTALLAQQLNLPATTRLLLLGDDSEMDAVTYALLHRALAGELDGQQLLQALDDLSVDEFWRDAIERLLPPVRARRGALASPVDGIFINQTDVPNLEEPASAWLVDGLSRHHRGAWPLALELEEAGWVASDTVEATRVQLLAEGLTQAELDAAQQAAIDQGFLGAN